MPRNKRRLAILLVVVLAAVIAMAGVAVGTKGGSASAVDVFAPDPSDGAEIVVAQITDTHYYPFSYTSDSQAFKDVMITGTKLLAESSFMVREVLDKLSDMPLSDLPDVLLVTGDITLNGELQGHIEVANLLRQAQNAVRARGKTDFQVLAVPGNHDLYNPNAFRYDYPGKEGQKVHSANVSRRLFTQIYAGLGYPDMTEEEMRAFYDSIPAYLAAFNADNGEADRTAKTLVDDATELDAAGDDVYPGDFVVSSIAEGLQGKIQYQFIEEGLSVEDWKAANPDWNIAKYPAVDGNNYAVDDYGNGEITYLVDTTKKYVIAALDEELDSRVIGHHVGGTLYDSTIHWLEEKADGMWLTPSDPTSEKKTLIGLAHHNFAPHFDLEQTILKDFTINEWKEAADVLADLGMRFIFTGHMHSNDIVLHTAFSGNRLIDCETSSSTGFEAGMRFIKMQRGTLGSSYAENYSSRLDKLKRVEITKLFTDLDNLFYLDDDPDSYINSGELAQYIEKVGDRYFITDAGEYAVTKLFRNIIDLYVGLYVNTDFLGNAGTFVAGLLPESSTNQMLDGLLKILRPNVEALINNLIDHIESVTLKNYHYTGSDPQFKENRRGAKLGGYLMDLVDRVINLPVNSYGDTFADFALTGYLTHVGGLDQPYDEISDAKKEAFARLKDGSIVKDLIDILLDKEHGLYPIVEALLTDHIDLSPGVEENLATSIGGLLSLLGGGVEFSLDSFCVQEILPSLIPIVTVFLNVDLPIDLNELTEKPLMTMLDEILTEYVTDSFYTGLGEIAHDIMYQFYVDESYDAMSEEYETIFAEQGATYVKDLIAPQPSVENGQLPGMLDVNFGEDPTTDKNFVWFTDRRISGTEIQYMEGEFAESAATTVHGEFEVIATTTASIDLGVYATLMNVALGRHTVSLTGLKPGTNYSYRVGSASDGYWSEVYTFATAREDGDFSALLLSDLQGSARITYEKAAKALTAAKSEFENGYDFVINSGDAVDNSRNGLQYKYMRNGDMASFWGNTTEVFAFGNHDKYAAEYEKSVYLQDRDELHPYFHELTGVTTKARNVAADYYNLAADVLGVDNSGLFYSFDYSDVHFTVLNTNALDSTTNRLVQYQVDWLRTDLEAAQAKKYQVVVMHKGLFSSGSHITDKDVVALRAQLAPIFTEYGVDLVVQGHDHTYSESYFLRNVVDENGVITEEVETLGEPAKRGRTELGTGGTLYVTVGTMGDKFYAFQTSEDIPLAFGEQIHGAKGLSDPTFGKLTYEDGKLYYEGFQVQLETGKVISVHEIGAKHVNLIIALAVGLGGVYLIVTAAALITYFAAAPSKKAKKK